ncbi:MAG TPA: hypothetical protein VF278_21910 [Pirellulales bacterium]
MSFLLDTNVLSAHFRRPSQLAARFFQHSGRLYTSTVVLVYDLTVVTRNVSDFQRIPGLRLDDWLSDAQGPK